MYDLNKIEESFNERFSNISLWPKEAVIEVDLDFLLQANLLNYDPDKKGPESLSTRYFQAVEKNGMITLVNDDFIIWIVPFNDAEVSKTYTMIALNHNDNPQMEVAFITSGIYNTSRLVIRILEKLLFEIEETQNWITKIK